MRREPGVGLAVLYEYADNANTRLSEPVSRKSPMIDSRLLAIKIR